MSATAEGLESEFVPTPEGQRLRDVFDLYEFGVALIANGCAVRTPALTTRRATP